ncbi:amino acid/amide ABC transporter membrane protein 1 (HAAT family) [Roseiarcus fermentans]|uniref:Amino acid/amide ABC transporter membrane protein 1 (HAAT family) n=1 Tax=Roseiarcus fermentans TaxID=1473586 RepID=A0A366FH47_9HYPH|nr:branched-chain amino acid ABC transporter permease [Roseiarcus fermentans]RBP14002.1 amino acid/amide ABC transporter membrane protein 1 (HAAT family) [Roseiarcus fermentans]
MITFLQNVLDALSLGSLYALTALGIGLIFGVLKLINFAHGDFITFGAYALIIPSSADVAQVLVGGWSWELLIPTVCIAVIAIALASDYLVFRPLRGASPPTLMAASFALSYVIQNAIMVIYGARPKSVNLWPVLGDQTHVGPLTIPNLNLVTIAVTLALMVGMTIVLRRTSVGIQMRAAAEDFRMARYLGVRADLVIGLAFVISGALAAVAALLLVAQTGSLTQTMGQPIALFAFIATVVGGMGSLAGAVVGGFVIGAIVIMFQAYLPPDLRAFRDAFAFAFVILVLVAKPSGLLRAKGLVERV